MYTLNVVRVSTASGSGSETSCPECPECPEFPCLLLRLPVRLHVRVRVHAYKSLAFAFSPYQAIRIFYFNLITPNGFKLLLSLSTCLFLSLSLSLFVSASVLRCALAFVTLQVWFLLLISICPHIVTPRLGCQLSTGPARSARLECWHPGCCPIPPRHYMMHCLPLPHCERASTNESWQCHAAPLRT